MSFILRGGKELKISVLQPFIKRGDIKYNYERIQRLIFEAGGELLLLPEYAFTGSIVLEENVDLSTWINETKKAIEDLKLPQHKYLLLNYVTKLENGIYNCCKLYPTSAKQCKQYPDRYEIECGIRHCYEEQIFTIGKDAFKVIICSDMRHIDTFNLANIKFIVFVYHFTEESLNRVISDLKVVSKKYDIPIIVSSLVSDKNIGYSSYINQQTIVSLPSKEGILEIEI